MKHLARLLTAVLLCGMLAGFSYTVTAEAATHTITLSSVEKDGVYTHTATLDGAAVKEYDYTWHVDPTVAHDEVKDSPAEYYSGTKPNGEDAVYIAHDIYYYPLLEQDKFQQINYDGESEWAYFYEAKGYESYIFSTLPTLKTGFPTAMMHTAEDAYQNAVLHITQPGTYALEGDWHGQIRVDLGEDSFDDPTQKVTLILNGVNVECTVASGVVFAEVYECDNTWEEVDTHSHTVDTTEAGATVVLADGTENTVTGTNIFRLLKAKYKDEDSTDTYPAQKKRLKTDGAFYSYRSMNITGQEDGTGILNIHAGYEGLNSELHLTINGGNVNIYSQDDGINVNEDDVSVLTVNGGSLHICAGLGAEGDGVDSNGYLVINGGTVISVANPGADSGLDSDRGSYVNGGTVVALGSTMDWAKAEDTSSASQAILNMRFAASQSSGEAIIITDETDTVVFAYDPDKDEVTGSHQRTYSGAIISAAALKKGNTYRIYVGGDVTGTEQSGVYDAATVTAFSGATRQCYGGTTVGGFGGMGGGMQRPDKGEMPSGDMTPPEGFGGDMTPPEGFGGDMPNDFGGNRGERPDFEQNGAQLGATCGNEANFELTEIVNAFSSVTDYRHALQEKNGHYVCSSCGLTFADAAGTEQTEPGLLDFFDEQWTIYLLFFGFGAAVASAVATVIFILKSKHE